MWVYKTYKTGVRKNTNAVQQRLASLPELDLSSHEDRQLVGYCYLEYVK
jgi:hypothetical protein